MVDFAQNTLVKSTREVETVFGEVDGGQRTIILGTNVAVTPDGTLVRSGLKTGRATVACIALESRWADAAVTSQLHFMVNDVEMEDYFRATFPAPTKTVVAAAIWSQSGTPLAGGAGPTLTVAAGELAAFIGCEGAILVTTDPLGSGVDPANLRDRPILAVAADGSQIDFEPLYTTGGPGEVGEPLVPEGPLAVTVDAGSHIRDGDIANARSINIQHQYTGINNGDSFFMGKGQKAGTFALGVAGKGNISLDITYMGQDYDPMSAVDQGTGTDLPNAGEGNCNMVGGRMAHLWVGAVNDLSPKGMVTSFDLAGDGTAAGIDDTAGSIQRAGVTLGESVFTGGINFLNEHDITLLIANLARIGGRTPIDLKVTDQLGNYYWIRAPETVLKPGGPAPEEAGNNASDISFEVFEGFRTGEADPVGLRQVIVQRFDITTP